MVIIITWLICAVISASIAGSKGRSVVGWFVAGCLISIFAVIWVACLPKVRDEEDYVEPRGFLSSSKLRAKMKCPDCAEIIYADANVCKHCGYRFDEPVAPQARDRQLRARR